MRKSFSSEKAAGVGAVLSAALASVCCILPPVLGAIGLSGAVLSAFFEPLRPYLLVLSAVLLAVGFYFAFRKPAQGEACGTDTSRLSRAARPTLFFATLSTMAFAMFPSIVGLGAGGADTPTPDVESSVVVLHVDGMTCESCAPSVRAKLLDVPGVIDAAVSYERRLAVVRVRDERPPGGGALLEAVKNAGYSARVAER